MKRGIATAPRRLIRAALPALPLLLFARDAPARPALQPRDATATETPMTAQTRAPRGAAWAAALAPVVVTNGGTGATTPVRLYGADGELDEDERARASSRSSPGTRRTSWRRASSSSS